MPIANPIARQRGLVGNSSRSHPGIAYAKRSFADARVRTLGFAYLFAVYSFVQPWGFRRAYPSEASRIAFATSFGSNKGLRIFYGEPYNIVSTGGYSAWRVGGTLAIAAAIFGVLAAVRALRQEEETGRMEIVLSGVLSRRAAYGAAAGSIALQTLILGVAEFAGFLAGGLPAQGSAYLALATITLIPIFAGVGAIASAVAPTRRLALELGSATVALFLLLRVIADTTSGGWLRWTTPLGWAEQLRPFASSRPWILVLPLAAISILVAVPVHLGAGRDIDSGLISANDEAEARLGLLTSPIAQAVRQLRGNLLVWGSSVAAFGFILGVISQSVSAADIPKSADREIEKFGAGSLLTPAGYISFVFFFFILAIALFTCAQLVATRREEAEQQLETLLAQPVGRTQWLGGRVLLATGATGAIAVIAGIFTWLGAESVGVHVAFGRLVEAGANCIPSALFFLGVATLAYAVVPRASSAVSYAAVLVTFLWQAVGSLLGAPHWVVDLTPFGWVGLVPTQTFRLVPALVMIGIGAGCTLVGLGAFRRRDLLGA